MSSQVSIVLSMLEQIGDAIAKASADLEEVKRQLREHPEIDTSATDDTQKKFEEASER